MIIIVILLNVFAETTMGISLQGLDTFQQQYRTAVYQMGELFIYKYSNL